MLQLGPRQTTPATHKCGAMSLIGFEYDTEGSTIHRLPHSTACKSRSRVCPAPKTPSFIGFLLWFPSRDLNPGEQQSQPTRTTQFHSEIKIGYWISYRWHRALRGPTSSAGRGSWKGARCLSFSHIERPPRPDQFRRQRILKRDEMFIFRAPSKRRLL
jgi:hypothetical protein